MYHKQAIQISPLQAYVSALIFSPASSLIRGLFEHEEPKWITIQPPMRDKWSACLQTLEGHSGAVNSVAFSHDSTRLASASWDRTVKIWDTSSGACLQTLEGHSSAVYSVAFSHDSTRLASASGDGTVKIWDASSGECLWTFNVGSALNIISFDATGSYLHTEIGTVALDTISTSNIPARSIEPQNPQYQGAGLSPNGEWITWNSKNVVWLPSEYRPLCSAVSGRTISIGVGSGKVWMCTLNVTEFGHS